MGNGFFGGVISGNASNLLEYLELRAMEPLLLRPISSSSQKPNTIPKDGIIQINSTEVVDFELFPNPASNEVYLETFGSGTDLIVIYDYTGHIVYNHQLNINENKLLINTGEFSNGVYLVQLITSLGNLKVKKLVVQ